MEVDLGDRAGTLGDDDVVGRRQPSVGPPGGLAGALPVVVVVRAGFEVTDRLAVEDEL